MTDYGSDRHRENTQTDVGRWLADIDTNIKVGEDNGGITLSEWEEDFVASIKKQASQGRTPSDKQLAALQKIWERC